MTATASVPGERSRHAPTQVVRDRPLHPGAWWLWAIGLAATASRTSNALILGLVVAVVSLVVWACRTPSPLAHAYRLFLRLALVVILLRLVLQILFSPRLPGHVIVTLPSASLPEWAAGISLGGPVTVESLVAGFLSAARLAVVLICVGAVNTLTSPGRLLRSLPAVLYEAGVAVTVALSSTPEAILSVERVREARLLRGRPTRGPAGLRGTAIPVLEGALSRSLTLAASMDARGYGRRAARGTRHRVAAAALVCGLVALCVGAYGLLAPGPGRSLGLPGLGVGAAVCGLSLVVGSAGDVRTRYRPIRWDGRATAVAVGGVLPFAATFVVAALDPQQRGSKRQKDLADIARIVEKYPELRSKVPQEIRARLVDDSATD